MMTTTTIRLLRLETYELKCSYLLKCSWDGVRLRGRFGTFAVCFAS